MDQNFQFHMIWLVWHNYKKMYLFSIFARTTPFTSTLMNVIKNLMHEIYPCLLD